MDIRLIATDLDGTLLGEDGAVPEINARALRECEARGIRVMLSSGRSFESASGFALGMGINPVISSVNGARVDLSLAGDTVSEVTMGREMSLRVYETLCAADVYFMAFTRGKTYMANLCAREKTGTHRHEPGFVNYGGHPYEMVGDPERVVREGTIAPYKYVLFGKDYDPAFAGIRESLSDLNLSISSSWRDNMEIMCPGVDKGFSLKLVAERLGIPREGVMAFGDNTNDLPMFESAGYPVAMENAEDSAKRVARKIAPRCGLGGVGRVIEEVVLCGRKG